MTPLKAWTLTDWAALARDVLALVGLVVAAAVLRGALDRHLRDVLRGRRRGRVRRWLVLAGLRRPPEALAPPPPRAGVTLAWDPPRDADPHETSRLAQERCEFLRRERLRRAGRSEGGAA